MKMSKTLLLLLMLFLGIEVFSQTNTLDEFSLTIKRRPFDPTAEVVLRGSNFEIYGNYQANNAPRACQPCTQNGENSVERPRFSVLLSLDSINGAKGYVNGVYYPSLYFSYQMQITGAQNVRIPRTRKKSVKIFAGVTLTGQIGIWKNYNDVGNPSLALFLQDDVALPGKAYLTMNWIPSFNPISGSNRLYDDRILGYEFSSSFADINE